MQPLYSGVSQGDEMPPTVTLSSFWPVMLIVFTGLMTLPTLVISAVVVSRIPEPVNTSGITASIDTSSVRQLNSMVSSLTSIKNSLVLHSSNIGASANRIDDTLSSTIQFTDSDGNSISTSTADSPHYGCTKGSNPPSSNLSNTERYIIGKDVNDEPVLLARVCPAICASASHLEAIYVADVSFKTNKPYTTATMQNGHYALITLNPDSTEQKQLVSLARNRNVHRFTAKIPGAAYAVYYDSTGAPINNTKYISFDNIFYDMNTSGYVADSLVLDFFDWSSVHMVDFVGWMPRYVANINSDDMTNVKGSSMISLVGLSELKTRGLTDNITTVCTTV